MRPILTDIMTIMQHLSRVKSKPDPYRPEHCPDCNHHIVWKHGSYFRKSVRDHQCPSSLELVPISRYICVKCKKTCSTLPECIPPRRWYLWAVQQACMVACLLGKKVSQIATEQLPRRQTISRWERHRHEQFKEHQFYLLARFQEFGRQTNFKDFWSKCLSQFSLSRIYYFLNLDDFNIP